MAGGGGIHPPEQIGLWDPETGSRSDIPAIAGQTCYAAFSPDGPRVMERCDGDYLWRTPSNSPKPAIALWDLSSGSWISPPVYAQGAVWGGAFSPDGRTFATSSDDYFPRNVAAGAKTSTVTVWDTASLQPVAHYHLMGTAELDTGVAYSPDGRLLAAVTNGGTPDFRVWDLTTGDLVAAPEGGGKHQIDAWSIAFSPDGRTLAVALSTGTVRFLDTSTWKDELAPIQGVGESPSIAYSADGSLFAIADAGRVSLWDGRSSHRLGTYYQGPPEDQYGTVRFLPDGRIILLTAYAPDGSSEPAFLFRTDVSSWKAQACSIIGDITAEQWRSLAPEETFRSVCATSTQ